MITYQDRTRIAAPVGGLRLYVWHVGGAADETGGLRRKYAYRISDEHNSAHAPVEAYDLYSGVSSPVDPRQALSTLVSFLTAAGEAYWANVRDPGRVSETADLFPPWVAEVAYINDNELAELAVDLEKGAEPTRVMPDVARPNAEAALEGAQVTKPDRRRPDSPTI